MESCLSLWKKSTLTPTTPQSASLANSARRTAGSCMRSRGCSVTRLWGPPELYESQSRTPRSAAYRTRSRISPSLCTFQFASTREYSQPNSAARSTYSRSRPRSRGLSFCDHQLHATRPGRTQLSSSSLEGGARCVTRSEAATSPADPPRTITRHGSLHGVVLVAVAGPRPSPSPACGPTNPYAEPCGVPVSRDPWNDASNPASVTSSHACGVSTRKGKSQAGPDDGVPTGTPST